MAQSIGADLIMAGLVVKNLVGATAGAAVYCVTSSLGTLAEPLITSQIFKLHVYSSCMFIQVAFIIKLSVFPYELQFCYYIYTGERLLIVL